MKPATKRLKQALAQDKFELLTTLRDIRDNCPNILEQADGFGDSVCLDVRLCVDFTDDGRVEWAIRTGDTSYDQRHSHLCGSNIISWDTDIYGLLDDLYREVLDQCADYEASGIEF